MKRIAVAGVLSLFALSACATAETKKSFTPKTVVVVKGAKKRAAEANYQVSPEESRPTGSGGTAR
jgi:hypothetical protein